MASKYVWDVTREREPLYGVTEKVTRKKIRVSSSDGRRKDVKKTIISYEKI